MPAALDGGLHFAGSRLDVATANIAQFGNAPVFGGGLSIPAGQLASFGAGESGGGYSTSVIPQLIDIRSGTTANPDGTPLPLLKLSRKMNLQAAQVAGVGTDEGAGLYVVTSVVSTGQVQASSIVGIARTASDYSSGGISADAGGIVGIGISTSTRVGIGGYFEGDANGANSLASAAQFGIRNSTGSDHSASASGFPNSGAGWVVSLGANQASAGWVFGNPSSSQMDVGIHFNAQVSGGKTGPTVSADIRSDSTAAIGYLLQGTHATAAQAIAVGSGTLIVGGITALFTPSLLEVRATASGGAFTPLAVFSHPDSNNSMSVRFRNGSGSSDYFAAGGSNQIITGTIAGDTGIVINTANKFFHIGPAGGAVLKLGQNSSLTSAVDHTFAAHIVSTASGTPTTTNLGANVSSVTFTGNDVRGTIAVVMSGALAANTRISTNTFAVSYGATSPKVTLVDQTSAVGLAIVNFYVSAQATGVSFDLACDQALGAGTFTIDYICLG